MTIQTEKQGWLTPALRLMVAGVFSAALLAAASGLSITAPFDGTVVSPGQSVVVTVTPSGSFTEVVVVGEGPIGFSQVLASSPYQFSLPIPVGVSPGRYALTAMGVTSSGNVTSLPITVSVERPDAPVQIEVTPSSLNLPIGQRMPLRVVGTYADGSKLDITRSANTTFSSTSPGAVTVDNQGAVTAASAGAGHIVVNNSIKIPVVVPKTLWVAPIFPVVYGSQSAQFSAFQPGLAPVSVRWSISPQVGSISTSGVYTAPRQIAAQQAVTVTATLKNDATKSVSTGVALFPPVALSVFPAGPVVLKAGQTQRFSQTVLNALDQDVEWSISSRSPGTIDSTGLYTAPATIKSPQTVVVTATSIADQSKTATSTISLQP